MPDANWKHFERRVAKALRGRRAAASGVKDVPDVFHPTLSIECKYLRRMGRFIPDALAQADASNDGSKISVLVHGQKSMPIDDTIVMMRMNDFVSLMNKAELMPEVEEGETPPQLFGSLERPAAQA